MSNGANLSATYIASPVSSEPYALFLAALGPTNPPYEGKYEADQMALWRNIGPGGTLGANWKPMNKFAIDPENAVFLGAAPATCSWGPGRIDMFVAGQDGSLWHIWADDAQSEGTAKWGDWEFLSYPAIAGSPSSLTQVGSPFSLETGAGFIYVWFTGADGNLWLIGYLEEDWFPYRRFQIPNGLSVATAPSAVQAIVNGDTRDWTFVIGNDANLWYLQGEWASLDAPPGLVLDTTSAPSAFSIDASQYGALVQGVGVLARASDGSLWCRLNVPGPQEGSPGVNRSGVVVAYGPPARIGPAQWQPWMQVSDLHITSSPVAVHASKAFVDVVAVSTSGDFTHTWLDCKNPDEVGGVYFEWVWSSVQSVETPQPLIAPPCAVAHGSDIDVLTVTTSGGVLKISFQSGTSSGDSGWSVVPANGGFAVQT